MDYQRVRLKLEARQAMKETRSSPRLVTLLFMVVSGAVSWMISLVLSEVSGLSALTEMFWQLAQFQEDVEDMLPYLLWSFGPARFATALLLGSLLSGFLNFLWSGLMSVGYSGYCLSMVRRKEPKIGEIFGGFSRAGGVLLTKLLVGVFQFLWAMLFSAAALIVLVVSMLLFSSVPIVLTLIAIVCYVGMIVGVVWVALRYSMVDFLIMDQGLTGLDAIRESKRLMEGNVGKLFVLRLSFIGWYLLEFAIVFAGILAAFFIIMPSIVLGSVTEIDALIAVMGGVMMAVLVIVVGVVVVSVFLTPYITGSTANFYDWARGAGIGGAHGGADGWSGPGDGSYSCTWSDTTSSGTGPVDGGSDTDRGWGSGGWGDGGAGRGTPGSGGSAPKEPRDDPWE